MGGMLQSEFVPGTSNIMENDFASFVEKYNETTHNIIIKSTG